MPVRRDVERVPRDEHGSRALALPEAEQHVREPDERVPGPPSARLIDFGSAWYARCANESPSTTRRGASRERPLEPGDRLLEPVGRDARPLGEREAVRGRASSTGAPYATRSGPSRASRSVPEIPAGTSGTPASSAMRAAPVCQRASCRFRMPFRRLVPSGNMTTAWPARQSSIARRRSPPRPARRAARGTPPPAVTIAPSGNQKSSDFAMKRRKRRGKSGIPSGHGSKFDQWFAASTSPPVARDVLERRSRGAGRPS